MNPGIEKQFSYFMYILIFQQFNCINFKIF